ncbi:MAG TPA: hypothetical protein DD407_00755 [Pseudohongiella sp.]|nr:hypothetical protein [Gammaproteobacteria bacterium]HBN13536.1 hypothetical protein [Pseudohongiella sp.]
MILSLIGWLGTSSYLVAHFYLALTHNPRIRLYYVVNLLAAVVLVFSSAAIASWQAAVTNLFWALISLAIVMRYAPQLPFKLSESWLMRPCVLLGIAGLGLSPLVFYQGMSLLGWAGTAMFVLSYLLFASGVIQRRRFLCYNTMAAYGLVPILYLDGNLPVFVLELAWGTISLVGLLRLKA